MAFTTQSISPRAPLRSPFVRKKHFPKIGPKKVLPLKKLLAGRIVAVDREFVYILSGGFGIFLWYFGVLGAL